MQTEKKQKEIAIVAQSQRILLQYKKTHQQISQLLKQEVPSVSNHQFIFQSHSFSTTILQYQNIPSTMVLSENWDRKYLNSMHAFCFVADMQSQGRGQKQNKWESPSGNLYMTLLLEININQFAHLPVLVSNSVRRVIKRRLGENEKLVKCKWVNDIFVNDKKVSGFLLKGGVIIEERQLKQMMRGIVELGIGINLKKSPLETSTYLDYFTENPVNRDEFCKQIIEELIRTLYSKKQNKLIDEINEYMQGLLYMHKKVMIMSSNLTDLIYSGIFESVNELGHAIILGEEGRRTISDGRMLQIE